MAEKPELAKGSWSEKRVPAPPAHWFFLVARPPYLVLVFALSLISPVPLSLTFSVFIIWLGLLVLLWPSLSCFRIFCVVEVLL